MLRKILWISSFLLVFVLYKILINYLAFSSIGAISLTAVTNKPGRLSVYYQKGLMNLEYKEKYRLDSVEFEAGKKETAIIYFRNRVVNKIRLDLIQGPNVMWIERIKIVSFFGSPIVFTPEEIITNFSPNDVQMTNEGEAVKLTVAEGDPYLELIKPIKFSQKFIGNVVPFFLALITILVLKNVTFASIYAFEDVLNKKPSTTENIAALDGLRGFAAILVLADHSGLPYSNGLGAIGVWIFFSLSGLLLAIPFVHEPSKIISWVYVQQYFLRRIRRILPMYYFILLVTFLFRGHYDNFFRHLCFLQGDGIFWSIPQEMYFYMVLPLVLFLNHLLFKERIGIIILMTLVLALVFNHSSILDNIWFYGNGKKMYPLTGFFLTGVCMSYFYYSNYFKFFKKYGKLIANTIGLVIFIIILSSSDGLLEHVFHKGLNYTWSHSNFYSYLSSLFLVCILLDKDSCIARIMSSHLLRAVGIVGFSFYLIHPSVLDLVNGICGHYLNVSPNKVLVFMLALIVTYLFSALTYSLIERPFLFKKIQQKDF